MKKFLAILLIAIIACSTASVVEEEEFELEQLPDWLKNGWSTLLNVAKKVVQFLKDQGLWDQVATLLKNVLVKVEELCPKVLDEELCGVLVGGLVKTTENGEVVLKGFFSWIGRAFRSVTGFIRNHLPFFKTVYNYAKPFIPFFFKF